MTFLGFPCVSHCRYPVIYPYWPLVLPSSASVYIIKDVMSVYLSVCMLSMAGQMAGPIKTKLGIGTHVDRRSVLVKVIYLCVRYNRIHVRDTWWTTMKHARSSSSSGAVAGATWWMLIKLLTEARKGRENSSTIPPSGGRVLTLVHNIDALAENLPKLPRVAVCPQAAV